MDGQEIIDLFEVYVDDSLAAATELILANQAYDRLNVKRFWNYLYSVDATQTISANTDSYSLPSDFLYPIGVKLLDSDGNYSQPYLPIPFKDRRRAQNSGRRYFIDLKNSQMTFTATPDGNLVGQTIEQDYAYQPAALTVATSPVFNRAFHPLIAMEMARFFWYNEQDEKDRSWDRELKREYDVMFSEMEKWDGMLETGLAPNWEPEPWLPENTTGGINSGFPNVPSNF